jgi:putative SOS response-associated peptidase YedK
MQRRRCVVIVDGFYEWSGPKGHRTKHWVGMADHAEPVRLAGLWERFTRDDESIEACTVLTCEPNELMAPIHNRMPLILAAEDVDRWLDAAVAATGVADLLRPHPSEAMRVEVAERPEQLDWTA